MNVGVFSLMQWPLDRAPERVYGDEIAQAVEAERLGYDRAWFAEHHFSRYGISPAIHLTVAHVAALTSRIRLGTAITILPFMHPIRAAEEIATLDILCGGRLDWGAGRGYQRHEFDAFGIDIGASKTMFQEALDVIFRAWGPGAVEHRGTHWSFDAVDVLPKPLQVPRVPTYIACISPESVAWTGSQGLPLLVDQFSPFDRLVDNRREHVRAFADARHPGSPPEAVALRQVFVGRTRDEAREIIAPALLWYYRMLGKVGSPAKAGGDLPTGYEAYDVFAKLTGLTESDSGDFMDLLLDKVAIAGEASEVADRITALHEAGYASVITWSNFGGIPHEQTLASMRRFIDDVAPKLPG
jgi:alkanesulfonate monooxygenase SsuD/methylene tetrahydromethanopterin reductase-like flavin-dependent oxidoreductase (luciferase family)